MENHKKEETSSKSILKRTSTEDANPSPKKQKVKKVTFKEMTPNTFEEEMTEVKESISFAFEHGQPILLENAFNQFGELTASEEEWELQATALQATRWLNQDRWKDVVGGHIVFS